MVMSNLLVALYATAARGATKKLRLDGAEPAERRVGILRKDARQTRRRKKAGEEKDFFDFFFSSFLRPCACLASLR
jgi:hypothetical protein